MKKLILLVLLLPFFAKAQTYQLNYDSIRVGKTAGTGATSLYGKTYLKNVSSGLSSDSILTVRNGRIFKIPHTTALTTTTISNVANANGISITGDQIRLHQVSDTTGGVLTAGNDTIGGNKYFNDQIWVLDNNQFEGHIGIVSGSGSLMAPLLGSASETSSYWMQILAHPASNLYNTNPTDGIIFQIYQDEGPTNPTTAGRAFNFRNGTTNLFSLLHNGDGSLYGGLTMFDNRISNGGITLGSESGSLLAPSLGANSESANAWISFQGNPASNINNTNPTDAFRFNSTKSTDGNVAMDGGNLVNFRNNNTSKFSVDYAGVITSAGLTNGAVYSLSGELSNTAPTSGTIGYWSRTGTTLSPATSGDNLSTTGSITGGVGSFTSSGSTGAATITQSSGAGVGLTITKGGNGEGLIVDKTSGSGNAVTVTGDVGITGTIQSSTQGTLYGTATGSITSAQLATSLTNETGSGSAVFATSPTLVTPVLGNATGGTLSLSGQLTSTIGNNTFPFNSASATTGFQAMNLQNTSGRIQVGIEGSSAGSLMTGGSAYAGVLTTVGAKNLELGTNQTKALTIDGTTQAVTVAGNISAANLDAGRSNPTITNGTNITSSSVNRETYYSRTKNIVSFTATINVTTTSTGNSDFEFTLPIASNFTSTSDGAASITYYAGGGSAANKDFTFNTSIANDRLVVTFNATASGTSVLTITGHYIIL
jgi:hypothetical protein